MAKDEFWSGDTPVKADAFWEEDTPAARRDLPAGVKPSTAGAGRGTVNPAPVYVPPETEDIYDPMTGAKLGEVAADQRSNGLAMGDAKRTNYPGRVLDVNVPPMSLGSVLQDTASGALQIGPTAVKGVGDLARLATGDTVGKGISDFAEGGIKSIQDVVGSDRATKQRQRFGQDMQDPALNAADVMVGNPGALADQVLPTLGSMALPMGTGAIAAKLATGSRAAKLAHAIDPATVAARANAVNEGTVIGTTVLQNASDTYGTVRDAGGAQDQSYLAAAITAPFTYVAGRLTGGGAEGQAARLAAGQRIAHKGKAAIVRSGAKEGGQETGEEVGQYLGETTGQGAEFDANTASKRLAVAGTLGAIVGGGVDVAGQQIEKLKAAGETEAAASLKRKVYQQQDKAHAEVEVEAMATASPEHAASPIFQDAYREARAQGVKPGEAAARAGIAAGFKELAANAGLSEKAAQAALAKAATLPLDKVPAFLEKFSATLASSGMGKPIDGAADVLGTIGDNTMAVAVDTLYGDTPAATMDSITALEGNATKPLDTGNDILVDEHHDKVHAAATSPLNNTPEPTDAQKDAGNYKVGHVRIGGMDISVENPQGSMRRGVSTDGKAWETTMADHYGYFRGTTAADGHKLDVFVKPGTPADYSGPMFVVDQVDPKTGKFDEHKIVMGAADKAEAEAIYRRNYDANWKGMGAITPMDLPAFKAWAQSGHLKDPLGELPTPAPASASAATNRNAEAVPAPAADSAAAPVQRDGGEVAVGDGAASAEPDGALKERYGRDGTAMSEGGVPFKTREGAEKLRKKLPQMRVVAHEDGFALALKTPAQLAAQAKASTRLRNANTSPSNEPIHAHGFIAGEGGLVRAAMSELGFDKNVRVGNRTLFAGKGKGMTLAVAAEKLHEAGYLKTEDESDAIKLLEKSLKGEPQYTEEGWARIGEAAAKTQYEDHLAAQMESEDPLAPPTGYSEADLKDAGYTAADDATKTEVHALLALAEDRGIDTERIREDASRLTADKPEQAYYDAAKSALEAALAEGRADRGPDVGVQADAGTGRREPDGGNTGKDRRHQPAGPEQAAVAESTPKPQTPAAAGVPASGPTWELRPSGTLAIKGNQTQIIDTLKAGGIVKTMIMDGGIMVAKKDAAKAQAILEGTPLEAPAKPLSVGLSPSDTVLVTVKDGAIMLGKDEALNFDSGEPITVPAGATDGQIKKALKDGGALSRHQHFYGGAKEDARSPLDGKRVDIEVTASDGTKATLKLDAGKTLRALDQREKDLQKLKKCVGGAK